MKLLPFAVVTSFLLTTYVVVARTVKIEIAHTTDVHGAYFPHDFITDSEATGSLARVCSAVNQLRTDSTSNLILLDNGDILQGQPTAYYFNYEDTITPHLAARILDFMGYDAVGVGNHDVETCRPTLQRYAATLYCPMVAANIIDRSTGKPLFEPYKIIERDGVKVAVIGLITPAIPAWLPENVWHNLEFRDMEETAREWIPIIKHTEHPHAIVGLFHSGQAGNVLNGFKENASAEVATNVPGFDAIMMGHDHRRELRKTVNCNGDSVLLINPANAANHLAITTLTLNIDDNSGLLQSKRVDGRIIDMAEYKPDSLFMATFGSDADAVSAYVKAPVGEIEETITTRDAYFGPSAFVDLVHKLQLAISGAEISMTSPLAFDAEIKKGKITVGDMFNLYKYENLLYVIDMSGQEIKDYLEMSYDLWTRQMSTPDDEFLRFKSQRQEGDASRASLEYPSYTLDSAAGIIYEVDVTKPRGEKIKILSMADGTPFDYDRHYRVATNSYRA
ncbi:MAG: bifunctional metallophosphatase/5'-nucleotidase, partial [Muribaculum sp.]|nr:bifunctional metallophosphatase/5'-nucleotidase [Muribaculum sp.]